MAKGTNAAGAGATAGSPRGVARGAKPSKPYPDFPLFPHATGRWAKKINGRFAFFGPWADPHAALEKYLGQRDALYAGRLPGRLAARAASGGTGPRGSSAPALAHTAGQPVPVGDHAGSHGAQPGPAVRDLVNHFLTAKQRRVDSGEMGLRAFNECYRACGRLVAAFGASTPALSLSPDDFARHRASLARTRGPVSLGNEVGRVRSVFKHAFEAGLLDRPVRFGPEFTKPAKRTLRLARRARGERMFEPAEVKSLLDQAGPQMKAMVLLGLNCGLGNTDVGALTWGALDLKSPMLEFPRPKTGIARRAVLWPETVEALQAVRKAAAKRGLGTAGADPVFVTKYCKAWVRVEGPLGRAAATGGKPARNKAVVKDSVAMEFGKLVKACGLEREGRGFYALRHTFRTVADEVGDRRAVDLVMGHEDGQDIATAYVERIDDARLRKVAGHVRGWLGLGGPKRARPGGKRARASTRQ